MAAEPPNTTLSKELTLDELTSEDDILFDTIKKVESEENAAEKEDAKSDKSESSADEIVKEDAETVTPIPPDTQVKEVTESDEDEGDKEGEITEEDVTNNDLRKKLAEKEIERRKLQSQIDQIKEQQLKAEKEILPKQKQLPIDNLSPQDFMPDDTEYYPAEAGIKGTSSHRAWQEYQREVTIRLNAEREQRVKAEADSEFLESKYRQFAESVKGDKEAMDLVDDTIAWLSSDNPNDFIGYDMIYKIGLLRQGKLTETKTTVKKIAEHKQKLDTEIPPPFASRGTHEEDLSDETKAAKKIKDDIDAELGIEVPGFLEGATFKK